MREAVGPGVGDEFLEQLVTVEYLDGLALQVVKQALVESIHQQ